MSLRVDLCSFKAAEFAVKHWHYSRTMPCSKTFKVGAWESDKFIGAVIFSWGSNRLIGKMFGLEMTECAELTRVALCPDHLAPTSKILAIALKVFKKHNSGIECLVSYADCDQNHHGGIYQATNWYYLGLVQTGGGTPRYRIFGRIRHGRSVGQLYGRQNLEWLRANVDPNVQHVFTKGKHKYAMPFSDRVRRICESLKQPYPKRETSIDSDAASFQEAEGGASPTVSLQKSQLIKN